MTKLVKTADDFPTWEAWLAYFREHDPMSPMELEDDEFAAELGLIPPPPKVPRPQKPQKPQGPG